jgi:hypothetical protein
MSSPQKKVLPAAYYTDQHNEVADDKHNPQLANSSDSSSISTFTQWFEFVKDAIRKALWPKARPTQPDPTYLNTNDASQSDTSVDMPQYFAARGAVDFGSFAGSRSLEPDGLSFSPAQEQEPLSYGRLTSEVKGSQTTSVVKTGDLPKLA